MRISTVLAGMAFLLGMPAAMAQTADLAPIRQLTQRVAPTLAPMIVYEQIESPTDTFNVSARDGKVLIKGNNPIAMAVGLNNYLRRDCGVSVSWFETDPVQLPAVAPLPKEAYGAKAAVPERFFLNYCTFGYTTPFWKWQDWERFIDWMALNGINLPLAMTGQEKAWYTTWKKLGLTDQEARESFTGPAHLPWHWMANVDHYQGPLSHSWLDSNEALQRQILSRERELGMRPVLPAFAGHVPSQFRTLYPDANITLRSSWGNFEGPDRCYFLDPSDPLYAKVQQTYLQVQDSLFGTDHIYGIDPFNEVDSPDWSEEFLRNASAGIFNTLRAADPEAKWLQMTWNFYYDRKNWTKPRVKAFLSGVPEDNMILLDYFCDSNEVYKLTDQYFGKPYVWCYLGNFGGNTMLAGNLPDVDKKIAEVTRTGGDNLIGIGGTLEGFDVNPVMHEYVFAKAWNPDLSASDWAQLWANTRGGNVNPKVKEAWKLLADSIYVSRSGIGQASLTDARPALEKRTGYYTNPAYGYTDRSLAKALDLLLEASDAEANDAYQFDVMNVMRQMLGNRFTQMRGRFTAAYRAGERERAKAIADSMDALIVDLDALMATRPSYTLAKWVDDARAYGNTPEEKDALERNARTILTIWGYPATQLNDYANRQWSGLLKSFYRGRWKIFTDRVLEAMAAGKEFDENAFRDEVMKWEGEWVEQKDAPTPISKEKASDVVRRLRTKYFAH